MNKINAKVLAIIPARWASSRLPGKPLELIGDKSMVQRVYEQVTKCNLIDTVIVATDDQRIYLHCQLHNMEVMMTDTNHISGTDRIAEVANKLDEYEIVINIQGDEPFINPAQIRELIHCFDQNHVSIATQCKMIDDPDKLHNYNVVKVVSDKNNQALYFSRQAIPAFRDRPYHQWIEHASYYQHIGIYGFRRVALLEVVKLPVSTLEKTESLEQLRWLENGYPIYVQQTGYSTIGIDTYEDLEEARSIISLDGEI